ncbi:MAG TPA: hypothetical protein VM848_12425 [Acidimicrobiia bacterium]|nr:hypothetical protein [Acidimicrobiia bacterium]
MVSREDDRILYDDSVDEIGAVGRGPLAVALAVLALIAGIVYVSWTAPSSGSNKDSLAHETSEPTAIPKSGFDASSSDIKACDGTRQARPDFSIVVAGAAADGQQVVARVVQFVVVDSNNDPRHGPDVQAQSLCTLP